MILVLGNRHAPPSGDKNVVFVQRRENGVTKELWGEQPFTVNNGDVCRLKLELFPDALRITVNGQTFQVPGVTVGYKKFYLQLEGWQPPNRWHVRSFSVH